LQEAERVSFPSMPCFLADDQLFPTLAAHLGAWSCRDPS
jgi:hypothetical protein